jgi:hypothetical protein
MLATTGRENRPGQTRRTTVSVWVVVDPDHTETPIAGVWRSMEAASEHCPSGYVVLKVELDIDLTKVAYVSSWN